ncbi:MAG: cell division ATP-binding protein FtsE, partial [Flavobacteriaceae bacterium]
MDKHIISFEGATISQDKKVVLREVSFSLVEGAFVYLIGRTGTGKSSLLKTLYGDIRLREGTGKVVDCDLLKLRERHIPDLRRQLGVVFQDFQLLSDRSVEKNLDFVLRATGWKSADKRTERITEVLEAVGLEDKLKFYPHELSGGEQQRIAISRALLNKPKLILADEPT